MERLGVGCPLLVLHPCRGCGGLPQFFRDCDLAVTKYTASGPGKSNGSVFMSPEGYRSLLSKITPPISFGKVGPVVLEPLCSPSSGKYLSALFDDQYDIVSWDPRGSTGYYTLCDHLSDSTYTNSPYR